MDTIRLLQTLNNFPQQDVIHYYIISQFLKERTYNNFIQLIELLDHELKHDYQLSKEQKSCIQYLFRDWGHLHLKKELKAKQAKAIFLINDIVQKPGHFMEAIDFAKRNPKNNELLMRFGLTLLVHSALDKVDTKAKIDALEQLLTQETLEPLITVETQRQELKTILIIGYNITLALYCIWMLTKITYPPL